MVLLSLNFKIIYHFFLQIFFIGALSILNNKMDQRAQIITEKIKPYTARVNELEESIRLKDEESMILRLAVE